MTTISLRAALPADRDAVIDLIRVLNSFEADLTGDRKRDRVAAAAYYDELMQRLARREGRIILAEADGITIGAMGFSLDEDAAYVVDALRRHGTVTDLVVIEEWRSRGVGRLVIGALVANEKAERTYRAFGFDPYVSILVKAL
jgi:GNAT superfamily N-acetyltransferase